MERPLARPEELLPQGQSQRRDVAPFRLTFAARLIRNDADLVTVKELLGHSSVSVPMRYAHTNRDARKRAVGLIAVNGAKLVTLAVLDARKGW